MNLDVEGGARLFYSDVGAGEVIVLLHGNLQSSDAFDSQINYFSRHYRLILIDSRGQGKSTHGNLPLTLDLMAEDVLRVLSVLNIEKFNVIGFSDGANLGIKLAIKVKDRLTHLVLISPNTTPSALRTLPRLAYSAAHIGLGLLVWIPRVNRRRELLSLITKEQAFSQEDIASIQVPCLVIGSEFDLIHHSHFNDLKKTLPQCELVWLKGMGHMRLKTSAEVINLSIEGFLRTV